MLEYGFVVHILLALTLGFVIGLQREMRNVMTKTKDFGGGRTFAMISLFAYLCAELSRQNQAVLPMGLAALGLLLVVTHFLHSQSGERRGTTSEFAALVTFALGASLTFMPNEQVAFIAVITVFVLHTKEKVQALERFLSREDLNASVLFMMMTFVILPLLPNAAVDPMGLVNLYKIWLMVVLVAGISFGGYICVRVFGAGHGVWLTGLLGGLVSSTSVTLSLARKSALTPIISRQIAVGICTASTIMLVRALIVIYVIDARLGEYMLPMFAFTIFCAAVFIFILARKTQDTSVEETIEYKNPLELKEALLMGVVFGIVLVLIKLANTYIGEAGVYMVSFASGLGDIDAAVLSLSQLVRDTGAVEVAAVGVALAVFSNSITKFFIVAFLGTREIRVYIFSYYAAVCLALVVGMASIQAFKA